MLTMTLKRDFNAVVGDSGGGKVSEKPRIIIDLEMDHCDWCLLV